MPANEEYMKVTNLRSRSIMLTLQLYSLSKQATVGDNHTYPAHGFNLMGTAKWNAWNELKGMSQEDAEKQYIALVDKLKTKY